MVRNRLEAKEPKRKIARNGFTVSEWGIVELEPKPVSWWLENSPTVALFRTVQAVAELSRAS